MHQLTQLNTTESTIQKASNEAFVSSKEIVFAMVAGEVSGDTLGANLMTELQQRYPNAKFVGIGGTKMLSLGLESWYPMEHLSVMGFFEVLKSLRKLLKLRKELTGRLISLKPHVFIGIDAPDFNFTLERNLKKAGISTIHYVGPSVWAWREKRLLKIRKAVDGVLVLFPFEPKIYHRYQIPVEFVGHPLAAKRPKILDKAKAREALGLSESFNCTAVLVGSRMSEIEQMSELYLQVIAKLQRDFPQMHFLFPVIHDRAEAKLEQLRTELAPEANIHFIQGKISTVLQASDQALVTSGTATLECALYELPMVIAIKVHKISYWIMKRLATTEWVGLPNVLASKCLVVELIQDEATVDNLYREMRVVIGDKALRDSQISEFKHQYQKLNVDSAKLASNAIERWANLSDLQQ